jgi:hypothetical protein
VTLLPPRDAADQKFGDFAGAELTEDAFLGGRLRLRQPAAGYRAAIDPVLLAAAVPAAAGNTVADLGCGVATAGLCLLARVPGARVSGLELQAPLAELAIQNATLNSCSDRLAVVLGDVTAPPAALVPGGFDHVMLNPPYLESGAARVSAHEMRRIATVEGPADLAAWIACALGLPAVAAPGGERQTGAGAGPQGQCRAAARSCRAGSARRRRRLYAGCRGGAAGRPGTRSLTVTNLSNAGRKRRVGLGLSWNVMQSAGSNPITGK